MIYTYTIFLHGIMGLLCLINLAYLFFRLPQPNQRLINSYFNWFLFFLIYNLLLIFPLIVFRTLSYVDGVFYAFALLSLGIAAWYAFITALHLIAIDTKNLKILSNLYLTGVVFTFLLHIIFAESPRGTPDGNWVLWHSGGAVSYFYILFMFITGWTFAFRFFTGIKKVSYTILKLRSLFLGLGAFFLPFAALYYFGAGDSFHVILAFIFSIIGLAFTVAGNLFGKILTLSHKQIQKI